MKQTGFNLYLAIVLGFIALAILGYATSIPHTVIGFFSICAFVFLMLLPSCSREV